MPDITIQIKVPAGWVNRVFAAFTAISGKRMSMEVETLGGHETVIGEQQDGESNKAFSKRVIRSIVLTAVRLNDKATDRGRYKAAISQMPRPSDNIPDEAVE